jgi:hypothetical protein
MNFVNLNTKGTGASVGQACRVDVLKKQIRE